MNDHDTPDASDGHGEVGVLVLPWIVLAALEREARERGIPPLGLVREILARWAMGQGPV